MLDQPLKGGGVGEEKVPPSDPAQRNSRKRVPRFFRSREKWRGDSRKTSRVPIGEE